jgi:porphyrinogen peroxidase
MAAWTRWTDTRHDRLNAVIKQLTIIATVFPPLSSGWARRDDCVTGFTPEPPARPQPQPILGPLTSAAMFLVVTVNAGGEAACRDMLGDWAALQRAVGFRAGPHRGLACVAGISSHGWDVLFAGPGPAGLHPFRALSGARHQAPATPGDLLFHIRADRMDLCFEFATQVMSRLDGAVTVADEVHGFRFFDERDLLGFVDGTENPVGGAAFDAVVTSEPGFEGGSYVIVQKYLHDMPGWNALTVEDQERAIGRSKLSDIEMPDDVKPPNSHVALNTIVDADGTERQIVRQNMPFGTVGRGEYGTYFIGYAASPDVTEQMLENMFIGSPPGNHDRVLDFSTAVTGGLFFVPSADFLDDIPAGPAAPAGGSLGIGSLKGELS